MEKIITLRNNAIFPAWFTICSEINNEYSDDLCFSNQPIYHYTNIDGFMSILKNRDFWISNIRYMNDSQEFENGKNIFKNIYKNKIQSANTLEKKFFEELIEICEKDSSIGSFKIRNKDIFAMSFCSDGDLLTQWQIYGNGGVAIGFDNPPKDPFDTITFMDEDQYEQEIIKTPPENMYPHDELRLFPRKIIYDDEKKGKIFDSIVNIGLKFMEAYSDDVMDMCLDGISDALFYYFALMKDANFKHENESRFLYYFKQDSKAKICFRKRGNVILPYLRLKILDVNCCPHKIFPINDIVVAPGSQKEYVADSIKYFLEKTGYDYLIDKVRVSQIPYRGYIG